MGKSYTIRQVPVYIIFHLHAYLPNPASTKTPVGESLAWTRKVKRLPKITGLMLPHRALVTEEDNPINFNISFPKGRSDVFHVL